MTDEQKNEPTDEFRQDETDYATDSLRLFESDMKTVAAMVLENVNRMGDMRADFEVVHDANVARQEIADAYAERAMEYTRDMEHAVNTFMAAFGRGEVNLPQFRAAISTIGERHAQAFGALARRSEEVKTGVRDYFEEKQRRATEARELIEKTVGKTLDKAAKQIEQARNGEKPKPAAPKRSRTDKIKTGTLWHKGQIVRVRRLRGEAEPLEVPLIVRVEGCVFVTNLQKPKDVYHGVVVGEPGKKFVAFEEADAELHVEPPVLA